MQDSYYHLKGYSPRITTQNSLNKLKMISPKYQSEINQTPNLRFQSNSPINKFEHYIRSSTSYHPDINTKYNKTLKNLNNQRIENSNMMNLRIGFDLLSNKIDKLNNIIKLQIEPKKSFSNYLDNSQRNNSNISSNYYNQTPSSYLRNNSEYNLNVDNQNTVSNYQNSENNQLSRNHNYDVYKHTNLNISNEGNKYEKYIIGNQYKNFPLSYENNYLKHYFYY